MTFSLVLNAAWFNSALGIHCAVVATNLWAKQKSVTSVLIRLVQLLELLQEKTDQRS